MACVVFLFFVWPLFFFWGGPQLIACWQPYLLLLCWRHGLWQLYGTNGKTFLNSKIKMFFLYFSQFLFTLSAFKTLICIFINSPMILPAGENLAWKKQ